MATFYCFNNDVTWIYDKGMHYINHCSDYVYNKNLSSLIRVYCRENNLYFINTYFNACENNKYYRYIFLRKPANKKLTNINGFLENETEFYCFKESDIIAKLHTQSEVLGYLMKEMYNLELDKEL